LASSSSKKKRPKQGSRQHDNDDGDDDGAGGDDGGYGEAAKKGKGKKGKAGGEVGRGDDDDAGAKKAAIEDPFDVSALRTAVRKTQERLAADLAKLKPGGKFNPQLLEELRVTLGGGSGGGSGSSKGGRSGGDKGAKNATARLGDVAQVIPRGRTIVVMMAEKEVGLGPF
jgi:ribosome recycling factor